MNKKASDLRAAYTKKLHGEFLQTHSNEDEYLELIESTLFKNFVNSGGLDSTEIKKFAYSVYVTRALLDSLHENVSSITDVFLISKVVEQGYFKLVKDFESLKIKNNLSVSKEYGTFFTPLNIAREMARIAVNSSASKVIIDPCCGTGNLLAACMEYASESSIQIRKLIGVELDVLSANVCKRNLDTYKRKLGLNVEVEIIIGDSLAMLSSQGQLFEESFESGTFIINPPYGKLKFDLDKTKNDETRLSINDCHVDKKKEMTLELQAKIRASLNGLGVGKGFLEWSKVFFVLCSNRIDRGESLVFIGPCGWLNSVSQSEIRRKVFDRKMIKSVHFLSETYARFETVNQSLAIVTLQNTNKNNVIEVTSDFESPEHIKYKDMRVLERYNYPIPRISFADFKLFIRLQTHRKLKDISGIKNLRGELDQSLNKSVLVSEKTSLKVVRGENIGRYINICVPEEREFYADEKRFHDQIGLKPKGVDHKVSRIVGRQCSYMKQNRRLVFDVIPANCVVGNSCNYLVVDNHSEMFFYLGLLNSALMDWYFRVLNGNNHVANYEIDDFPIPDVGEEMKSKIITLIERLKANRKPLRDIKTTAYMSDEYELDALVFEAFDLSTADAQIVLKDHHPDYIDRTIKVINEDKKNVA